MIASWSLAPLWLAAVILPYLAPLVVLVIVPAVLLEVARRDA